MKYFCRSIMSFLIERLMRVFFVCYGERGGKGEEVGGEGTRGGGGGWRENGAGESG